MAEKLQCQSHILITADLAIYSKAQQIIWDKPPNLNIAYISAIGDEGLWGFLKATEVSAEATVRQMLQGKQYDRRVRGIRLVTEALLHLRNKSAAEGLPWLSEYTEQCTQDL